MNDESNAAIICLSVIVIAISLLLMVPHIHQWEKDANYPLGKMCEVYRNCK